MYGVEIHRDERTGLWEVWVDGQYYRGGYTKGEAGEHAGTLERRRARELAKKDAPEDEPDNDGGDGTGGAVSGGPGAGR